MVSEDPILQSQYKVCYLPLDALCQLCQECHVIELMIKYLVHSRVF